MPHIEVRYLLQCLEKDAPARADLLRLEQSVELPRAALSERFVLEEVVPEIGAIEARGEQRTAVTLRFSSHTVADDPAQLPNLLFGNSSLLPDVTLEALRLPPSLDALLPGPRFGLEGLREALDAPRRPLSASALKPLGHGPERLAELARTLARGGIDVIKDDHGLADHTYCPFAERVAACQRAVEEVAEETGHRALYVPNVIGTPETMARQLDLCRELGVGGVMSAPMLVGLPTFYEWVRKVDRPALAHPALAGCGKMSPAVLFGTLFRAYGADASIFPHLGGRFAYTADECHALADALRGPDGPRRAALPVPAGGMDAARAAEIVRFYGPDVMLLIGGSLQLAGDALLERTREFTAELRRAGAALAEGDTP